MKVENERNTTMEMIGIKLEGKRITKQKCDMIVKVETNAVKSSTLCIFLGAKVKLTKLPALKEQLKLGSHQMAKWIFNSEVNLVFGWVVEHKPKNPSNKIYKCRTKSILKFVFQEDPQFDLAGNIVQVKDNISQIESGITMEPLDGEKFVYLSEYSVVELIHPTYSDVTLGMSKYNSNCTVECFNHVSRNFMEI
jgi:hypothetical protein